MPDQPLSDPPPAPVEAAPAEGGSSGPGPGRRVILHVLLIGLSLSLAGVLGIRGVQGGAPAALEAYAGPTPVVLAYVRAPDPTPTPTPADTPTPTPEPADTPTPTPGARPTPTPAAAHSLIPDTAATLELPAVTALSSNELTPAFFTYTVEPGDSLTSIATGFDICPDHILWNNPGREEDTPLTVGDRLLLPGVRGIVYRVRAGDSLESIATRYSTTAEAISSFSGNHLVSAKDLRVGMRILIPEGVPPEALLEDADAAYAYSNPSADGYIWPFFGPITTYYGEVRPGYVHNAIDIGGLGHYGAPVRAAAAGTVVVADYDPDGFGNYVVISHDDGSRTLYGHFSSTYVGVGDHVAQGRPIGALGCTGKSTGTHLHLELWIAGKPVDPLPYLP